MTRLRHHARHTLACLPGCLLIHVGLHLLGIA